MLIISRNLCQTAKKGSNERLCGFSFRLILNLLFPFKKRCQSYTRNYFCLSKYMFFPFADKGMPIITEASGSMFSLFAAVPILYIILLSMFRRLAVLAADPRAIPASRILKTQFGPVKSCPVFLVAASNSLHVK